MRFLTDDWKSDLRKLTTGGAWLFIGGSAFALLWLIFSGGGWSGQVFGTTVHGQSYTAPLLAYGGVIGVVWIWTQLLTVIAATGLTFMPWARPRRIGHALLIGWAGLWMLGVMRLAAVDLTSFWTLQTAFMAGLMGCTAFRAYRGWFPPEVPPTLRFQPENVADDLLKTVPSSDAPRLLLVEDVSGPVATDDTLTSTARHVWKDVAGFARSVWIRTRAAGQAAAPKIKSAAQQVRRSWASTSRSA